VPYLQHAQLVQLVALGVTVHHIAFNALQDMSITEQSELELVSHAEQVVQHAHMHQVLLHAQHAQLDTLLLVQLVFHAQTL